MNKHLGSSFSDDMEKFMEDLAAENEKLREALREARGVLKHTCNIEYGNDTGCERCVRCKILKALGEK